ncbi:MAG TPA: UDP-2,3-diacylglucosamine diphosphatase LpxI [candidate division Zixibacteria bacterium]|nr:UDP-2,3-diacylglucosamine diphosphatase LpxI [candidate division Zixibacteria bacterium]
MRRLGLIAGNGRFPLIFAREAKREGFELVAVAHRGETAEEIERIVGDVTWVYVGQLGKIIRVLRRAGVAEAVFAGGIRKARLFDNFRPDLRGAAFLARMRRRDDDALLRGVAAELEGEGIRVVDSTLCLSHSLAGAGVLTRRRPTEAQWADIRLGFRAAKEIGRLGIGQTVVVKKQVVVAVEAVEGTDAAIERGGELAGAGCVVVKTSKPGQDLRFDVPVAGVETIHCLRRSRAAALAVEAGKTLLLEKEQVIREADAAGIAVIGVAE